MNLALLTSSLPILFEPTTTPVDIGGFTTAITGSITPAQILTILGSVVGVGMGFVLMWFGVRKVVKIFSTALSSGKIKI